MSGGSYPFGRILGYQADCNVYCPTCGKTAINANPDCDCPRTCEHCGKQWIAATSPYTGCCDTVRRKAGFRKTLSEHNDCVKLTYDKAGVNCDRCGTEMTRTDPKCGHNVYCPRCGFSGFMLEEKC